MVPSRFIYFSWYPEFLCFGSCSAHWSFHWAFFLDESFRFQIPNVGQFMFGILVQSMYIEILTTPSTSTSFMCFPCMFWQNSSIINTCVSFQGQGTTCKYSPVFYDYIGNWNKLLELEAGSHIRRIRILLCFVRMVCVLLARVLFCMFWFGQPRKYVRCGA